MKCEFDYCVYNRDHGCILDDIQINRLGMCEECEIAKTPEEILDQYKEKPFLE